MEFTQPPIVSIVGFSDAGKTTLIEHLVPELRRRGLKVGTVKHDVHGFEMDRPGKDSWRHKQAGAAVTVISSPRQIGMVKDTDHDHSLDELLPLFGEMDIVLTEGYKRSDKPKVEIYRSQMGPAPLCANDDTLLAVVSDDPVDLEVPCFRTSDVRGLTDFLLAAVKG